MKFKEPLLNHQSRMQQRNQNLQEMINMLQDQNIELKWENATLRKILKE